MTKSRPVTLDPTAKSADPSKPAFLAKPAGSPVYHGFVVVPETFIDGWVLGEITPFLGEENGDGFVVAPDGSQAGLVWAVGEGGFTEIVATTPERWGVYAVWFPQAMKTVEDLIANFRVVLPALRAAYGRAKAGDDSRLSFQRVPFGVAGVEQIGSTLRQLQVKCRSPLAVSSF